MMPIFNQLISDTTIKQEFTFSRYERQQNQGFAQFKFDGSKHGSKRRSWEYQTYIASTWWQCRSWNGSG